MTTSNVKAIVPCDIHKVWENVLAVECYHTWRSDVSKTEMTDEKHFVEYTKDGYKSSVLLSDIGGANGGLKGFFSKAATQKKQAQHMPAFSHNCPARASN